METPNQLWTLISNNIWLIILSFITLIQITPIKINPWTSLFNWIKKMLAGNLTTKIDNISKKIDNIEKDVIENEKDRIRWEILAFANSCRRGEKHTRDEFQHIVALHDKYQILLSKTNDTNGVFEVEYTYIQNLYAEKLEKNDFL